MKVRLFACIAVFSCFVFSAAGQDLDIAIRHAMVIDGSGSAAQSVDVGIKGDRIAFVGPHAPKARREIDAASLDALLQSEIEARLAAAADYERHQQDAEAARLRHQAELIARYRA